MRLLRYLAAIALLTACGPARAGFTAPVAAFKKATQAVPQPFRSVGTQGISVVSTSPERVSTYPIPIPSDASTGAQITLSNASVAYNAAANGASISSVNVAIYASNGSLAPTGSPIATWLSQTIPGSGGVLTLSAFDVSSARGSDGYAILMVGTPDSTNMNEALGIATGQYVDGTSVVTSIPGGLANNIAAQLTTTITGYSTLKKRLVVAGDSLVNGYSVDFSVRRETAAFVKIGPDNDWAVQTLGVQGSTLAQWYDGSRPNYFAGLVVDSHAILLSNLSINSLPDWANLAAAQAQYASFISYVQGLGFTGRIVLCTLPASVAYVAKETLRQSVNTWLRTIPSGVLAVVDVAAIVDDPDTPSQLLPAYALADGTHWNATGHAAVATQITSTVGPLF